MKSIAEFIREDMSRRGLSLREYAAFLGSTHPTVAKYLRGDNQPQWDFLVSLSRATHTDIGTLARIAAPEAAFEDVPDTRIIMDRINQLPPTYRKTIVEMIDGLLYQQERSKD